MSKTLVEQVADAILYEGYVLYPYRPSSVKNRRRWTFGGVYPRAYAEAQSGADNWQMQTECLLVPSGPATLTVRLRFLHVSERTLEGSAEPSWQEAVEREVSLEMTLGKHHVRQFAFPASRQIEPLIGPDGRDAGVLVREQWPLAGELEVSACPVDDLYRVTVCVRNLTPFSGAAEDRKAALRQTLVSTHKILYVRGGAFVSLLDPPERYKEHAAACVNIGTYPVLAGEPGLTDTVLSSPIIPYDYPQVAPESPGDLFDATEIDEILTLRILTLTDAEKQEMGAADARARALLERTETLAREQLSCLHGAMRSLRTLSREGGDEQ